MTPQRIGRFELVRRLGEGRSTEVFVAQDGARTLALKRVRPGLLYDDPYLREFLVEARAAARLQHPNVVPIHDVAQLGPDYVVVMELVDGVELRAILAGANLVKQRVPEGLVAQIMAGVFAGLEHAHLQQPWPLVHGDVSPANVMVSRAGEVKLRDFGMERAASRMVTTMAGERPGHFAYLSPQQIAGFRATPPDDVWGAGVVMYELATGRSPFARKGDLDTLLAIRDEQPPPVRTLRPDLSEELEAMVSRALQREPVARPTAGELRGLLAAHAARLGATDSRAIGALVDAFPPRRTVR